MPWRRGEKHGSSSSDLPGQTLTLPFRQARAVPHRRRRERAGPGVDDLGYTLSHEKAITASKPARLARPDPRPLPTFPAPQALNF